MGKVTDLVTGLMSQYVQRHGLELVDVHYRQEQGNWFLRVFLDKEEGLQIEDCERANRWLSARLDEEDPIPGQYYLEVSSAGLDRPLKKKSDYDRFAGEMIEVKTYAPVDGRKNYVGKLIGLEGDEVIIMDREGINHRIPFDMVARAKLHVEF